MPTVISGILKDGMGKPIPNCTIELKALRTSTTVITKTIASQQPEKNGSYSMNVELGKYGVTLCVEGFPSNYVGEIYVHSGSVPGTLNYYLGLPTEGDLPPAAIQQFEAMVELVSQQSAQVGKDKAAAAKSAADALASQTAAKASETNAGKSAGAALASEKAAKTSETNTAKGIEAAAASAQAAKLSEDNADVSKKAAQTSAAEALASQGAAKTSETNAGNSAKAASGSADKAKAEADRATAATDGKQDENALLTAIAALNTAADQIITLTGKNSVETAVLTKFAKEMLAKTDADSVREYLGLKEALKIGDFGVGSKS
uniref:prophage tail fiber N-terminal domain-containing protein n=1 Tax=Hafnia alvei TaxID=569 RepID=UPI002672A998